MMNKYAVDSSDSVEGRAQEIVKMGSLDLTEARSVAQKESEDGSSEEMVEFRSGEGSRSSTK